MCKKKNEWLVKLDRKVIYILVFVKLVGVVFLID